MAVSIILMMQPHSAFVPIPANIFPFIPTTSFIPTPINTLLMLIPTTSYFDITNTNIFPFIIALLSVAVLVMLVISVIPGRERNDELRPSADIGPYYADELIYSLQVGISKVIYRVKKEYDKWQTMLIRSCLSICILSSLLSWLIYLDFIWGVTMTIIMQGIIFFLHVATLVTQIIFNIGKKSKKI